MASFLKRLFDQVNPFDNGRSFFNQSPPPASTARPRVQLGPRGQQAVNQGVRIRDPRTNSIITTGSTDINPIRTPFQVQGPAAPLVNLIHTAVKAPQIERLQASGQIDQDIAAKYRSDLLRAENITPTTSPADVLRSRAAIAVDTAGTLLAGGNLARGLGFGFKTAKNLTPFIKSPTLLGTTTRSALSGTGYGIAYGAMDPQATTKDILTAGAAGGLTGGVAPPAIAGAVKAAPYVVKGVQQGVRGVQQGAKVTTRLIQEAPPLGNQGFARVPGGPEIPKPIKLTPRQQAYTNELYRAKQKSKPFQGFPDLTTKTLEKLKGRSTVSKQFIQDLTNAPDLKQPEREAIRKALSGFGDEVPVNEFANKVKKQLLNVDTETSDMYPNTRYEGITLPGDKRGIVSDYKENIYESPIKTSAGDVHFGSGEYPNYMAHTRIEDLPIRSKTEVYPSYEKLPPKEPTRRVIEIQSDLFQKGRLEQELEFTTGISDILSDLSDRLKRGQTLEDILRKYKLDQSAVPKLRRASEHLDPIDFGERPLKEINKLADMAEKIPSKRAKELSKLEPYRNTWHERVIKEEIKKAAQDGKTKLQFPTGKTAMEIEGLGNSQRWFSPDTGNPINIGSLKVGKGISSEPSLGEPDWIITQVFENGKFRAISKDQLQLVIDNDQNLYQMAEHKGLYLADGDLEIDDVIRDKEMLREVSQHGEEFDISGKVDESNPIYRFYEKEVGKYLKNKHGAQLVTDNQGVQWWEVDVKPGQAKQPVEAYGAMAGMEQDENGNWKFNPEKAALGVFIGAGAKRVGGKFGKKPIVGPDLTKTRAKASQSLSKTGQVQQPKPKPQKLQSKLSSSEKIVPQVKSDVENILEGQRVRERGFTTSVKQSSKTPKALKQSLEGEYAVKSDKERFAQADKILRESPDEAVERALDPRSDIDITIGNKLLDAHLAAGRFTEFKKLHAAMANPATEFGRTIRAYGDYDKTTPTGAVKFAEAAIKKYNQTKAGTKNPLDLSTKDIKNLVDRAKKIQSMPAGRMRTIKENELIREVNDLIPSRIADKAVAVWKAGLLTSPRTTMRNIIGNTVHQIAEIAKDPVAVLNDVLISGRTGQRSTSFTLKGSARGARKGVQSAKDMFKYGVDPDQIVNKYDVNHVTWDNTPVQKALKKYTNFVFRTLGAQDQPFYHAAFGRSLYDQATTIAKNSGKAKDGKFIENLIKNPSEQMKTLATKEASTAVFKNDNKLRKIAGKFKQEAGKTQAGKVISELIAPFTGVPSSIAGQIVAYSPVGLIKGIAKDVKLIKAGTKSAIKPSQIPEFQRLASQEIGRGVIGTGLIALGAYLTSKGLMTGNPKDAEEYRQWQLEGKQSNSILINGKWRSINSVGPEFLVLLAGSKIQQNRQDPEGSLGKVASNIGKDFTQQTFLQGVQQPLNAIADPARYGGSYTRNQAASVIPNVVKDVSKAFDPFQREVNSVGEALQGGIPGLRNKLMPKRDALGKPLKQEPSGVGAFIDVFNSKTPVKNLVVDELSRLHKAGQNATPSKILEKTSMDSVELELSNKQRNDLEERIGTSTSKGFENFIQSEEYKKLTDEQKKDVLDSYRSDIAAVEKRKYYAQNQLGPYSPDSTKESGKLTYKQKKVENGSIGVNDYIQKFSESSGSSSESDYKSQYEVLKSDIDKGEYKGVELAKKQKELARLSIKKDYSEDVVDLYNMSKADTYAYITKAKDGDALAKKLLAYDKALYDAGLTKYMKYRNGLAPASRSRGGSRGRGSRGGKKGKYNYANRLIKSTSDYQAVRNLVKRSKIKRRKITA